MEELDNKPVSSKRMKRTPERCFLTSTRSPALSVRCESKLGKILTKQMMWVSGQSIKLSNAAVRTQNHKPPYGNSEDSNTSKSM